jgi:hypothetical protein
MNSRSPLILWLITSCILAGIFSLYLQPDFAKSMADQLWMCF